MERYLEYLRKSRMDTDFDEVSVEETMNRHRKILESFCKERRLNVVETLEEVVSGESLLRIENDHEAFGQRERNRASVNSNRQLANPFATILFCEKCGAIMKRNVPAKSQKTSPRYRCPTRGCDCRAIKCDFAENAILKAMEEWLAEHAYLSETTNEKLNKQQLI